VRPGGYLVVNDDFLRDGGSNAFPHFENDRSQEETVRGLQCHGNVLEREVVAQQDNVVAGVPEGTLIRRRAERLRNCTRVLKSCYWPTRTSRPANASTLNATW
jgi:hypothetical protein